MNMVVTLYRQEMVGFAQIQVTFFVSDYILFQQRKI